MLAPNVACVLAVPMFDPNDFAVVPKFLDPVEDCFMVTLFLVVDEVITFDKFPYRTRMWRQAGFPPLVLFSQIPGQIPPEFHSSFLANFALRNFLGYRLPIPVYFELSDWGNGPQVARVRYETIGCELRPILQNPTHTRLKSSAVEHFFGVTLDTLLKGAP